MCFNLLWQKVIWQDQERQMHTSSFNNPNLPGANKGLDESDLILYRCYLNCTLWIIYCVCATLGKGITIIYVYKDKFETNFQLKITVGPFHSFGAHHYYNNTNQLYSDICCYDWPVMYRCVCVQQAIIHPWFIHRKPPSDNRNYVMIKWALARFPSLKKTISKLLILPYWSSFIIYNLCQINPSYINVLQLIRSILLIKCIGGYATYNKHITRLIRFLNHKKGSLGKKEWLELVILCGD